MLNNVLMIPVIIWMISITYLINSILKRLTATQDLLNALLTSSFNSEMQIKENNRIYGADGPPRSEDWSVMGGPRDIGDAGVKYD
jgi:hypothetical protein